MLCICHEHDIDDVHIEGKYGVGSQNSTAFKQQLYCSFLLVRSGCCTIGCFLCMFDTLRWLKDQLYAAQHPEVFWYHFNNMSAQKNKPKKGLRHKYSSIENQIFLDTQLQPLGFLGHH